eukprot:jgi/Orpsp1_1/1183716/evm.model.c7180000086401.1
MRMINTLTLSILRKIKCEHFGIGRTWITEVCSEHNNLWSDWYGVKVYGCYTYGTPNTDSYAQCCLLQANRMNGNISYYDWEFCSKSKDNYSRGNGRCITSPKYLPKFIEVGSTCKKYGENSIECKDASSELNNYRTNAIARIKYC